MTSAWQESSGQDDRAGGEDVGPEENQLEMFEAAPRESTETVLPPEATVIYGSVRREGGERRRVEMMVTEISTRDFLEVGGAESDELRRLEDSIRWLMNEGSVRHLPRAANLPPVRGLLPVESHDDDSLLLNPDTLFPPRVSRRRGGVVRGAAKLLLVSAVAAPTAYFIANWMQFPGTAAPSDSTTVLSAISAAIPGSFEERIAAIAPGLRLSPPEAVPTGGEISSQPQPEPTVIQGTLPVETSPDTADAGATEPKGAPEQSSVVSTKPADSAPRASDRGEVAPGNPPPVASAPVTPSSTRDRGEVAPSTPPPVAAPPKLSAQEIAVMVDRGRVLFDAGDLAAARLFFRRAANAGDAAAALAMGATYDPDVLAKRFIRGIEADAKEARMWYEKARELGSPEGPRRIEMLAQRQSN
jgi:hypothetical protein